MHTVKPLLIHRTPYFYQSLYIFKSRCHKSVPIKRGRLSPQSSEWLSELCTDERIQARLRNCKQVTSSKSLYFVVRLPSSASEVLTVGVSWANLNSKFVIENWIFIWEQTNFRLQSL